MAQKRAGRGGRKADPAASVTTTSGVVYRCRGSRAMREAVGGADTCGTDITAQIDQVPADGLEYGVTCPVCGTEATIMRTPPDAGA